jgi:hypothetical protein
MNAEIKGRQVGLGDRAYDILIGPGLIGRAGAGDRRVCPARAWPSSPTRTSPPPISRAC